MPALLLLLHRRRVRPDLSSRPDLPTSRAPRTAAVKTGRRPPPEAARSGLDGGEHGAKLNGSGLRLHVAVPPFCVHANHPCSGSDAAASSRGSRPPVPAPAAGNCRHWGSCQIAARLGEVTPVV